MDFKLKPIFLQSNPSADRKGMKTFPPIHTQMDIQISKFLLSHSAHTVLEIQPNKGIQNK